MPAPVYYPPAHLTPRQQRLLLQLSATELHVTRDAEIDLDTTLIHAAEWLGLSRLLVLAEGLTEGLTAGFDPGSANRTDQRNAHWIDQRNVHWIDQRNAHWIDQRNPGIARQQLSGLTGIPHLRLLVLLGAYYAFEPDAWHSSRDSALYFLQAARIESQQLRQPAWDRQVLCLLGKLYVQGPELLQGNRYFDECIKDARAAGDKATEAKAWAWRGLYTHYTAATTQDRITSLQKARSLYRELKNPEGEINALTNIGYLQISDIQLKKGEASFKEALRLEDAISFPYTHYTTDNISMVGVFQGKYGEPLGFALQSVKTAEVLKDSILWGTFYHRLATLYLNDKGPEYLKWAQKSFNRFLLEKDNAFLYVSLDLLVTAELYAGRQQQALARVKEVVRHHPPQSYSSLQKYHLLLSNCYEALNNYDSAEVHTLEAARLEKQLSLLHGSINMAFLDYEVGRIYFEKGDVVKAKMYFERFLTQKYPAAQLQTHLDVHAALAKIDSGMGAYVPAMRHLQAYIALQDSSFNVQARRQSEELAVKYETEKKENEIQLRGQRISLLQQADRLRQIQLRQAAIIQRATIAVIVLLLLIAVLLIRQNRQKQKMSALIAQKNAMLEKLLTEKDWLLKEVNHRVKNNLHTVISLLESQAKFLKEDALEAIESSQHRIYAMSLIHQKIYQSENNKTIEIAAYLREFVQYLRDSFGSPAHIRFYTDIQPLKLGLAQAVPIALIVNEAVTNALKHAFPGNRAGELFITFKQEEKHIILVITDNGIGIDPAIAHAELDSLGIGLMKGLSQELRGTISFEADNGTTIRITFDADQLTDIAAIEETVEHERHHSDS